MLKKNYEDLLSKCLRGYIPTYEETVLLLNMDINSPDFRLLCYVADKLSREHFDNKGDVCGQIGINYEMCSKDCGFCAFSRDAAILEEKMIWESKKIARVARELTDAGSNAIYLMSTADFSKTKLIKISEDVRHAIPDNIPLVLNTGDFNYKEALKFKEVGITAVYHAMRLREGVDTAIPPEERNETIENAKKAGLKVQVCLEPVGPEHSMEELADQMYWARDIGAMFNGAMSRTAVPGTPLAEKGEITFHELSKYVAVSKLVMGELSKAHCTHEPNLPSLLGGANLLWAEAGPNPRDISSDTSMGRGASVMKCQNILRHAGYEIRKGASPACL